MFHEMTLGLCPQYISDLLPPLVAHINPYHRRRPLERDVTTCKTELNAQVIHCRLRLEMSNLNNDLVNRHLSTDPKCSCGYSRQTAEHYLLHCPNYINIRTRTVLTLPSSQTNIRTLLYGNLDLRLPENKHIFLTVHEFIKLSKRL